MVAFVPVEQYLALVTVAVLLAGTALVIGPLLERPSLGLLLLVVVAVVTPLELSVGTTTLGASVLLATVLCGLFAVRRLLAGSVEVMGPSRVVIAVLVFMAVAALSFLVGQFPWFATPAAPLRAQLGGLAVFLLSGGVFLVVGCELRSPRQLQRLTSLFIWLGGMTVLLQVVSSIDIRIGSLWVTNSASLGSGFWTWLVAMSVSQSLCNRDLSRGRRVAFIGIAALAMSRGLFLAVAWVSGWLPPLIAAGAILFVRFPRLVASGVFLTAALAPLVGAPLFGNLVAGESYSWMTRKEAAAVLWSVIDRNPWLGFGPANYYHYTVLFPILGWYVRFNSHNNYIDLVAQTGLVGLAAFTWFVIEIWWLTLRLRARAASGFARAYAAGVLGGLVGSLSSGLLGDWIIPFTYNVGLRGFRSSVLFWFFLGGALALVRLSSESLPGTEVPGRPSWQVVAAARA